MSKKFRITEIFGPTIQGEGPDAGKPAVFIRVAGCDFKCSWCDSLHAVENPHLSPKMSVEDIVAQVNQLSNTPILVVISGGNPALFDLSELVTALKTFNHAIAVETQGTIFKSWLNLCDYVVVSPKPPSSNMPFNAESFKKFLKRCYPTPIHLKIVVGTDEDYVFVKAIKDQHPKFPMYLSVLNPFYASPNFDVNIILKNYKILCEKVINDNSMHDVIVLPQLHTLIWGNQKGV